MKLSNCLSVAAFAFLGGGLRSLLGHWLPLPGILLANLLGCFLLALLTVALIERGRLREWLSLGLGTGMIGAFTTFSTFAVTTAQLATHRPLLAGAYFLVSSLGGLGMALAGACLARKWGGR